MYIFAIYDYISIRNLLFNNCIQFVFIDSLYQCIGYSFFLVLLHGQLNSPFGCFVIICTTRYIYISGIYIIYMPKVNKLRLSLEAARKRPAYQATAQDPDFFNWGSYRGYQTYGTKKWS